MLGGLFNFFGSRAERSRPATVEVDLCALEAPVSAIQISHGGDRSGQCAARWSQLDDILKAASANDTALYNELRPARAAMRAIAGTLIILGKGNENGFSFPKSNFDDIAKTGDAIQRAAEYFDRHPMAEFSKPGYSGNVVALKRPTVEIRGDTIFFAPPPFVNHAPELRAFVESYKAFTILLDIDAKKRSQTVSMPILHRRPF